jgi:multiple antibiotic resistance protein
MTHGHDDAFKRRLAFRGIIIAALGLLAAATIGANTLHQWGISAGALQLAAGIILFLIALTPVLAQYDHNKPQHEAPRHAASPADLALSPLAFPR